MKVFSTKELEEADMVDRPKYFESISGNPYRERVGNKDSRQGVLKIVKSITIEETLDPVTDFFGFVIGHSKTIEVQHGLGYFPYPLAEASIGGNYYPIPFTDYTGQFILTFAEITKSKITIYINVADAADFKMKLYLLRETIN